MATRRNVLSLKRKIDLLKEIESKKRKQADVASDFNVSKAWVSASKTIESISFVTD